LWLKNAQVLRWSEAETLESCGFCCLGKQNQKRASFQNTPLLKLREFSQNLIKIPKNCGNLKKAIEK
jgi:hypothetical protein